MKTRAPSDTRNLPAFVRHLHIRESVIHCFKLGLSIPATAKIVGIHKDTLRGWMSRGGHAARKAPTYKYREGDEHYAEFYLETQKALHDGILRRLVRIDKHAKRDWKADRWMLEKQHGDIFGMPDAFDIERKEHNNIEEYDQETRGLEVDEIISVANKMGIPLPKIVEHVDE